MACFLAPMAAGLFTTIFRKKVPTALKINWLNFMLWGGVGMLIIDHIVHGEIVFYPPFITAMQTPTNISVILKEVTVVGGLMTIFIVLVWILLVVITSRAPRVSRQVK